MAEVNDETSGCWLQSQAQRPTQEPFFGRRDPRRPLYSLSPEQSTKATSILSKGAIPSSQGSSRPGSRKPLLSLTQARDGKNRPKRHKPYDRSSPANAADLRSIVDEPTASLEVVPLCVAEQTQTKDRRAFDEQKEGEMSSLPKGDKNAGPAGGALPTDVVEEGGNAMTANFRKWRAEAVQGRYLPRYVQRIPKDQAELLATDGSWQPPLVGKPQQPGTVPIQLLNHLTEAADGPIRGVNVIDLTPTEVEVEMMVSRKADTPRLAKSSQSRASSVEDDAISEHDSEEELVSRSQWPPSQHDEAQLQQQSSSLGSSPPALKHVRAVPPDSPDLDQEYNDESGFQDNSDDELSMVETGAQKAEASKLVKVTEASQFLRASVPDTSLNEDVGQTNPQNGNLEKRDHKALPHMDLNPPPCTAVRATDILTRDFGLTVQVERTPKEIELVRAKESRTSTLAGMPKWRLQNEPAVSVVPGTCLDAVYTSSNESNQEDFQKQLQDSQYGRHQQAYKPASTQQHTKYIEKTPLMYEDSGKPEYSKSSKRLNGSSAYIAHEPQRGETNSSNNTLPITDTVELMHVPAKVLSPTAGDEPVSTSRKRKATSDASDRAPGKPTKNVKTSNKVDTDYADVDARRLLERREFFRSRRQPNAPIQHMLSDPISSTSSEQEASLPEIRQESRKAGLSPDVKTSDTSLSLHLGASKGYKREQPRSGRQTVVTRSSSASGAGWSSPQWLFEQFQGAYPAYAGPKKAFDKACGIIKHLKVQNRGLHQSLWDDFIFRYHSEYLPFLRQVIEDNGNALPYEEYYNNCVDEPVHLRKVIKPVSLDIGDTATITPSLPVLAQPETSAESKLDRSVTAESSVSNVIIQHKPSSVHNAENDTVKTPLSKQSNTRSLHRDEHQDAVDTQHLSESQESVHQWLEKAAGAASPELGTPVTHKPNGDIPAMDLANPASEEPKERPVARPVPVVAIKSKEGPLASSWWMDDRTPFKIWARHFSNLPGEVAFSQKSRASRLQHRQAHSTIDIFSWRR